jgi:glutaminyl-tRNA synthetase
MPTISGLRRRGVPAAAIRDFIGRLAISKNEGVVEASMLEHCIRDPLNDSALRRMAVLRPLKVVIENYPEGQVEEFDAVNNPRDENFGTRKVPFSRELYVERDDFMEDAPKKFFRLSLGREVRLRAAYFITCTDVIKDDAGEVIELRCTYDPKTRGGNSADGRKVKGTLHWVSRAHAMDAEVRLYGTLFSDENPGAADDCLSTLNPKSLEVLTGCKLEPSLADTTIGEVVQFERLGYFCIDRDGTTDSPVFNRTVGLRDSFAKVMAKG